MHTDGPPGSTDTSWATDDLGDLLATALSEPALARQRAQRVLDASPGPYPASVALQAIAIVERDAGHLAAAVDAATRALGQARRVDSDRTADVLATLAATQAYAGRTPAALQRLAQARDLASPALRPRVTLRRAHVLYLAARYEEALEAVNEAIDELERQGDDLWTARALNTRCIVDLARGDVANAERDARLAEQVFDALGQRLESAHSVHNRAIAALQRGDLVESLTLMDEVTLRYAALDVSPSDLVIDHAQTLLTAGLVGEAIAMTRAALASTDLQPVKRAEILLTAAQAALADGDLDTAEVDGDLAGRLFAAQHRPAWARRAKLLSLQAEYLADHQDLVASAGQSVRSPARSVRTQRARNRRRLDATAALVDQMRVERTPDLAVAQLLHGRVARDAGRVDEAARSFEEAAWARHTAAGLGRAAGWLAAAMLADLNGDRRALLHACRRGLDAVDEYRALLGDLELRALATRHGNELAAMALRAMLAKKDARGMLWSIERWRATALGTTPHQPVDDPDLERRVAALRDVTRRLGADDAARDSLALEQTRLEAEVRRTYRRQRAEGVRPARFDPGAILDALGDTVLVAVVYLDDTLYAITVADGRIRRRTIGPVADALQEARFARFALRRAAFGRVADVDAAAARLQTALLGDVAGPWRGRGVVVVPPADLLTAPWGLLPAFAETRLTVSPSATLWAAARQAPARDGHIALVTGPGLSTGESEVTALSPLHDLARSVGGPQATVAGALAILEGARLAHLAAHGTFRADAPMFSSLLLDDGPLTVHDLDRLERPPAEMVLSACDSGNAAPIGSHEALGLVSSLLAMGTRTVLASVVPVNDRATVGVMRDVHTVVGRGGSLAEGWLAARQSATDSLARATAAAFTAWGA